MPRSPRSRRAKGKSARDKRLERSPSYTRSPLPPSPSDSPSTLSAGTGMDVNKDIEKVVCRCLGSDDFINKIVTRLSEKVRDAVVDALSQSLSEARSHIDRLNGEVVHLKAELSRVVSGTEARSDELEQYQRRNNLRVFGIPENQDEDTDVVTIELIKSKLGINLPLKRVERSHRVGKPRPTSDDGSPRPRPIIVRFQSYRDRREVFRNKKCLKGTGITIREDLTPRRAEVLRKAVQLHGPRKVWTVDGRIMWEAAGGKRGVTTTLEGLVAR